jgi:uncharacterized protein YjdB
VLEPPTVVVPPVNESPAVSLYSGADVVRIAKGQTGKIHVMVSGVNGAKGSAEIGWSSSKGSVARVSGGKILKAQAGKALTVKVKATKVGATTIQLTGPGGVKTAVRVQVVPKPVKARKVSLNLVSEKVGPSALRVVTTPRNATWQPVTWSSANPQVATVDAAGRITVHAPGKAKITAKYGAKKATITLSTT